MSHDADLNQRTGKIDKSKQSKLNAESAKIIRGQITELLTNYGPTQGGKAGVCPNLWDACPPFQIDAIGN